MWASGIEVAILSKESEWLCTCVLVVSLLSVSTILLLDFDTIQTAWYFLFFILLGKNWNIQNENLGKGSLDKIEIFKMKTWEKVA